MDNTAKNYEMSKEEEQLMDYITSQIVDGKITLEDVFAILKTANSEEEKDGKQQ